MIDVVKFLGVPGSLPFVVVATAVGLALMRSRRLRPVGLSWLAFVAVAYLVLALPPVAHAFLGALPVVSATGKPCDTLIVLDGDNRRGRARESARLIEAERPGRVWILGEPWLVDELRRMGIPPATMQHDERARTTREQIGQAAAIARHTSGCVAIVASRLQAPRVAALVRAERFDGVVHPAPLDIDPPASGVSSHLPSYAALRASRDAVYELAALAYYRWHGWIQ